jgi:drug/metabolite transporter (DMT)-like permease
MKKGVVLSVLTAVVSGCSIFANSIFVSKTDPLIFSLVRNAIVALVLTGIVLAVGHWRQLSSLSKRQWSLLVIIGIIGGGIPFALFFTGLSEVGALNGNLIQKTLFLWVAILAVPILHERISKIQLVGYGVLFIGMFVLGGTGSVVNKTGTWLILVATILWAVENVVAKIALRSIPSTIVSWGRMVFGLPCLLIAASVVGKIGLLSQAASYNPTALVVSSMFLVVYVTLWYSALAKAPATLVSSVLVFAPVVTAMLTGVILHKPMPQPVVNLLLLTLGTVLVTLERILPKRQQQPV